MRDVEAIEACDRDELENVVLARVSSELTPKEANASRDDGITCSTSVESAIAGAAVVFVEAAKRGFDVGDVEATLRRDGGVSSEKAKLVANGYGKMRRTLERELKKYASSTSVKRLKEHRCRADYVVSTSASGEKREPTFHVSCCSATARAERMSESTLRATRKRCYTSWRRFERRARLPRR